MSHHDLNKLTVDLLAASSRYTTKEVVRIVCNNTITGVSVYTPTTVPQCVKLWQPKAS
jgi:hypothetical protein